MILLLIGCGKKEEPKIVESASMENLKWGEGSFPIQLKISSAFSPQSEALINHAMHEWEAIGDQNFFGDPEATFPRNFTSLRDYFYKDRDSNGVYFSLVPIEELGSDYLAVTQIYFEAGSRAHQSYNRILHFDVIVNGHSFKFSNDPQDHETYYLLTVVLHELGHALGLAHSEEGIMIPGMSTYDSISTLGQVEAEALATKYQATSSLKELIPGVVDAPIAPKRIRMLRYYFHKDEYRSFHEKMRFQKSKIRPRIVT